MAQFRFNSSNSVQTTGANQQAFNTDTASPDTLIVDATGALQANGAAADAVQLGANGGWKVTINGLVKSAQQDGLHLLANNPDVSSISIGKTGNVLGSRYGLYLESTASIVNAGNIEGNDTGIRLAGSGAYTIKNSGTIQNGQNRAIDSTGNSNDTLTNTGRILGDIQLYAGADRLANSGEIWGVVDMGSGDDAVTNTKAIGNDLFLGNGHDRLTNSGTIEGTVYAGEGDDTIKNSGVIYNVVLDEGFNTLINTGRIGNNVYGGYQTDIVKNSGLINGIVDLGAGDDIYIGGGKVDSVRDNAGSDNVKLGGEDDYYGAVRPSGLDGTDTVDGGAGVDTYVAESATGSVWINIDKVAHDFSPFAPGAATVQANTAFGADIAGTFKDIIKGFENVEGGAGADIIYGNASANAIKGRANDDFLAGYGGGDTLDGGAGMDALYGGAGRDWLVGGLDADVFMFAATGDSGVTDATRDIIADFTNGDRIELLDIDANTTNGAADDAFAFIGTGVAFSGAAGQLRAVSYADGWIVEGDVNGDAKADFSIAILDRQHTYTLTQADFVL